MNTMTDQAARPTGSTGIITGMFVVIWLLFWFFYRRFILRLKLFIFFCIIIFLCVDEVISSNLDCICMLCGAVVEFSSSNLVDLRSILLAASGWYPGHYVHTR